MAHHCHAKGCETPCKPELLMCPRHWAMVPKVIQGEVYATYRRGQCDDKNPSPAWHLAANKAIAAVATREAIPAAPASERVLVRGLAESPRCGECPFAKNGRPNVPVASESPVTPKWIALGEGPGELERRRGRPFVGPSGALVNRAMASVGAKREDEVLIGNAILCTPPGANDNAKRRAAACCAPRLMAELAMYPDLPIIAFGAVASQTLLGEAFSISQMAGAKHVIEDVEGHPRVVIPTLHPAAILRGAEAGEGADLLYWNLVYDVGKVHRLASGKIVEFTPDIETEVEDPVRAEELVREIAADARRLKELAVDTETDSLVPRTAVLDTIGIGTRERAVAVKWSILNRSTKRILTALFADSTIEKTIHNRIYDRPVLRRHGMAVSGKSHCTLLLHHAAFPGLPHDLQRVTTQIFLAPPWKAEYRAGKGSIAERTRYCALDTLACARLKKPLAEIVRRTQTEKVYEADLDAALWAEEMHEVGMPLDRARNKELEVKFKADILVARAKIEDRAADPKIMERMLDVIAVEQSKVWRKGTGRKDGKSKSHRAPDPLVFIERHAVRLAELRALIAAGKWKWKIGSNAHVVGYLKARGLPMTVVTEKGRISTKKEVLEGMSHLPEVAGLLAFREAAKMLSTFVLKVGVCTTKEGRFHPRWSVHKITGRWGAEAPQAQNWPKGNKKLGRPNLRTQVVAPPGFKLVGFDFSQLEARIIALLSKDPWLVQVFTENRDIHTEFCRMVWHDFDTRSKENQKEVRDFIKRTEYGGFYGGAIDTLWRNLLKDDPNVKREDVAYVVDILQRRLVGVNAWHEDLMRTAAAPPYEIRDVILGRRRCWPLGNPSMTELYNFPVQTAAASVMGVGLRRFRLLRTQRRLPARLIVQVHDACAFEVPNGAEDDVAAAVNEAFTQEQTNGDVTVRFPVDTKIGQSWDQV